MQDCLLLFLLCNPVFFAGGVLGLVGEVAKREPLKRWALRLIVLALCLDLVAVLIALTWAEP